MRERKWEKEDLKELEEASKKKNAEFQGGRDATLLSVKFPGLIKQRRSILQVTKKNGLHIQVDISSMSRS